jgi:Tfp pilus assembly protein PilN
MSQQINLYGPQFHPVRDPLPAARMLTAGLAGLVVVAGLAGWMSLRVAEARSAADATRQTLASRQAELVDLAKKAGARRIDPKLEEDLARAEAMHRARTELMTLLESGVLGTPGGFSGQMRALARQSTDGLWLTGFSLSAGQVELQGRALTAELVPAYLRRLGSEQAMAGVEFNGLRIAQPAVSPAPSVAPGAGPATGHAGITTAAAGPAFVEFFVASDARSVNPEVRQ